jgi:F-type H+-transporting ATPase subunit a
MFSWVAGIIALNAPWLGQIMVTVAEEEGKKSGGPHLPTLADLLVALLGPEYMWIEKWADIIFSGFTSILFCLFAWRVYRRPQMIPSKLQNVAEMLVEGMYNFIHSILGHDAKTYAPFLGTLFFYILMNNLWGILPLGHSPSTSINITGSLALIVFCIVQYTGIKRLGVGNYLYHLIGSPKGVAMWVLTPLFLIVHLVGEVAKPASLALRLFGNITGEDILVAAFVGLGIMAMGIFGSTVAEHAWLGLPLNVPFIFLGLLLSTIQALVFTLLSSIYILMMLPHTETH